MKKLFVITAKYTLPGVWVEFSGGCIPPPQSLTDAKPSCPGNLILYILMENVTISANSIFKNNTFACNVVGLLPNMHLH